jgi:ribonuclease HI
MRILLAMQAKQEKLSTDVLSLRQTVQTVAERLPLGQGTSTAAEAGHRMLEFLKEQNGYKVFQPTDGESILSKDQLTSSVNESELVDGLFGRLMNLLKLGSRVLVSSEKHPWLETMGRSLRNRLKPDLFVIHNAFYVQRENSSGIIYGVPAHRALYKGMGIIDVKSTPTHAAFGELIVHLEHLHRNIRQSDGSLFVVKGALAFTEGIWLVKFDGHRATVLEDVRWTDSGSAKVFTDFFAKEENEIAMVLDDFVKQTNFKPFPPGHSFLGAGGTGCVFQVRNEHESKAVKIVEGSKIHSLLKEFGANQAICKVDKDVIVQATETKVVQNGGWILMSNVCQKIKFKTNCGKRQSSNNIHLRGALEALRRFHETGFHHGDARRDNLLMLDGKYKWCDLQLCFNYEEGPGRAAFFAEDILTLLRSFEKEVPNGPRSAFQDLKSYACNAKFIEYEKTRSSQSLRDCVACLVEEEIYAVSAAEVASDDGGVSQGGGGGESEE